jgi:hypothetical protein
MMLAKGSSVLLWATAWVLCALPYPAMAAITAEEVVKVVEKAKILTSEYKVTASVGGGEARINTYRNPKASDKDCKIDAVLIAKEVMQADPSAITRVSVRFYDTTNISRYREVVVRQGDVKAFGSRQMSPDALLSSIEITVGDMNAGRGQRKTAGGVFEGPLVGERTQALGRIQMLRERGVGVTPFMVLFNAAEEQAKTGDKNSLIESLNALNAALNNADDAYNQAHRKSSPYYSGMPKGNLSGGKGNFNGSRDNNSYGDPRMGGGDPRMGGRDSRMDGGDPRMSGGSGRYGEGPGPDGMQKRPGNMIDAMKQQLGDMAPAMGPLLKRRYAVARRIVDLKDKGQTVDYYVRLYRDIESASARQDVPLLQQKLRLTEHELGIPSMDIE